VEETSRQQQQPIAGRGSQNKEKKSATRKQEFQTA
jgi:hypothetical protein